MTGVIFEYVLHLLQVFVHVLVIGRKRKVGNTTKLCRHLSKIIERHIKYMNAKCVYLLDIKQHRSMSCMTTAGSDAKTCAVHIRAAPWQSCRHTGSFQSLVVSQWASVQSRAPCPRRLLAVGMSKTLKQWRKNVKSLSFWTPMIFILLKLEYTVVSYPDIEKVQTIPHDHNSSVAELQPAS